MLSFNYENINNVMTQIFKPSCASFSYVNISYVLALFIYLWYIHEYKTWPFSRYGLFLMVNLLEAIMTQFTSQELCWTWLEDPKKAWKSVQIYNKSCDFFKKNFHVINLLLDKFCQSWKWFNLTLMNRNPEKVLISAKLSCSSEVILLGFDQINVIS